MDLTPYVDDLQDRLAAAADAAGDDGRRLAERLTAPLDAAVRLVLLDALSAAALEQSTGRPAAQARPQQRGSARVTGWVR
jgi:hypothetical protein